MVFLETWSSPSYPWDWYIYLYFYHFTPPKKKLNVRYIYQVPWILWVGSPTELTPDTDSAQLAVVQGMPCSSASTIGRGHRRGCNTAAQWSFLEGRSTPIAFLSHTIHVNPCNMYGIFTYMYLKNPPNVSYMDAIGMVGMVINLVGVYISIDSC